MNTVGTVESLWRYPVKSMHGEEMDEIFAGFSGIYCDRFFAFRSSASPRGFPYLTAREQHQMLRKKRRRLLIWPKPRKSVRERLLFTPIRWN